LPALVNRFRGCRRACRAAVRGEKDG
jgi:hypothetical protein